VRSTGSHAGLLVPQTREEALEAFEAVKYPLLLKAIDIPRFSQRNSIRMFIARTRDEAIEAYDRLEDPEAPNLMLQDYIPCRALARGSSTRRTVPPPYMPPVCGTRA
jgi:hypothetical protein